MGKRVVSPVLRECCQRDGQERSFCRLRALCRVPALKPELRKLEEALGRGRHVREQIGEDVEDSKEHGGGVPQARESGAGRERSCREKKLGTEVKESNAALPGPADELPSSSALSGRGRGLRRPRSEVRPRHAIFAGKVQHGVRRPEQLGSHVTLSQGRVCASGAESIASPNARPQADAKRL